MNPSDSQMNNSITIPWIEKYRPKTINDVILDDQIRRQIEIFIKDVKNTHLIMAGNPGIGKTSTAKCIAGSILGSNLDIGYLELNAAEDRGIKTIAGIIPPFCKKMVSFTESRVILLDEADNMTPKCQFDINELIKLYGHKVKFIFTCNDSSKIIEAIQSTCRIIHFRELSDKQIMSYLHRICKKEKVLCTLEGLEAICYISNGDIRKSINNLQLAAITYKKISRKNVLKVCKVPDPKDIEIIIDHSLNHDLNSAIKQFERILLEGYHYLDIINAFIFILNRKDMDTNLKLKLISIVSQTKINLSLGIKTKLQMTAMICRIIKEN